MFSLHFYKEKKVNDVIYVCLPIDHFIIVCSVTWPLNGSKVGGDLVLIQTSLPLLSKSSCSNANEVQLPVHYKSSEVLKKQRSPPASQPGKVQITEKTTVK